MSQFTLGVIRRTRKENERRLPIHPQHLDRIDADLRARIYLEHGYGEDFGVSDAQLSGLVAGMRTRTALIAECDVILLLKPDFRDLAELRHGQVLWGWPHCVQDRELTEQAIQRQLSVIAFESMNLWRNDGSFKLHVFHKNNETGRLLLGASRPADRGIDGHVWSSAARGRHGVRCHRARRRHGIERPWHP